jgi:DNA-binding transcriptional ArsR family regulator
MIPDFNDVNQYFLVFFSAMNANTGYSGNGNGTAVTVENGRDPLALDWERLARATAHPVRVSILEVLTIDAGRTLSPTEISRELQIPLSNTNYHVTELAKAGLIELVSQRQVRGAIEHFYRLPGLDRTGAPESAKALPNAT